MMQFLLIYVSFLHYLTSKIFFFLLIFVKTKLGKSHTYTMQRAKSTFLIVNKNLKNKRSSWTNNKKKMATGFSSVASHNVILFQSFISNHAKVRTCCVYYSVYSKILPNLDNDETMIITYFMTKKNLHTNPPYQSIPLRKKTTRLLFSITAFFLSQFKIKNQIISIITTTYCPFTVEICIALLCPKVSSRSLTKRRFLF